MRSSRDDSSRDDAAVAALALALASLQAHTFSYRAARQPSSIHLRPSCLADRVM
jgi:hypothetical protein